jgi:hypothetical protein
MRRRPPPPELELAGATFWLIGIAGMTWLFGLALTPVSGYGDLAQRLTHKPSTE